MRTRLVVAVPLVTCALLSACTLPAEPSPTEAVASTPPEQPQDAPAEPTPSPSETTTPEVPPTPEPSVTIAFNGEIDWPAQPPLPPIPGPDAPAGAWLQVDGGWTVRYTATAEQVACTSRPPDLPQHSSAYYFDARTHPVGADRADDPYALVTVTSWGAPTLQRQVELRWTAPGERPVEAYAGDGYRSPGTMHDLLSYAMSPDRRSMVFSLVAYSQTTVLERIVWFTATGAITCDEPAPEVPIT